MAYKNLALETIVHDINCLNRIRSQIVQKVGTLMDSLYYQGVKGCLAT